MERYVFRPWGEIALFGFVVFVTLFTGVSAQDADIHASDATLPQTPTLNLIAPGDYQQAVHLNSPGGRPELRSTSLVAPRYALTVSPQEWLRIYTNSPLGLPRSASAWIYSSARPEPCFGDVMIGCVQVDIEHESVPIPLRLDSDARLGFLAPAKPGSYWIALHADWNFGGGTQVFIIDVRA